MECRQELQRIIPELQSCCEEISAAGRQLTAHQRSRQQDIWMLVKVAVSFPSFFINLVNTSQ